MLTFISENPWITAWLSALATLVFLGCIGMITTQIDNYLKLKYHKYKTPKIYPDLDMIFNSLTGSILEIKNDEIENLDISIADPDSDFSN